MKNKRLILFAVLALVYAGVSFHRVTMAVMGDLLAKEFTLDPAELGLLGGILLYCYGIVQLPSGVLADNFGPRRTILLSLGFSTLGSAVFALAPGYGTALLGRILIGTGIGFIYLSIIKILGAWYKETEFGTILGMLMSLGMLGTLLATSPLAFSVRAMGWRNSYLLAAGLTAGMIMLVGLWVRDTPHSREERAFAVPEETPDTVKNMRSQLSGVLNSIWMLMRNRDYVLLLIFVLAGSSQAGFQTLWAGPFLSRSYGYTLVEVGNVLLWYSIGGVCGAPLWGYLSDRLFKSRKKVLMLTTIIVTLLWFVPAFMPLSIPKWAVPLLLFAITTNWSSIILTHAIVRESFSYQMLGVAVGIMNLFSFLGGAFFTQLMGHLVELFPRVNGDYPFIAYQSTIILIFFASLVRITALAFAREQGRR
jgi:sugar phosphate permease